ncbi:MULTISPECIES: septum formation family protein [unclassified Rathayibacter]|uniref:septum formation family protein n=1 Tax=unclassified Rathayibacter TaxID=2609250 RepID=UPI0006F8065B|nr:MULTISPECIES: septum formation family protein [unclassified Rathayibacter]KQQ06224.1 hypothetical protein ASF42_06845 [Rathayibacter sp. Leaf294]KQS14080.1 hypothetical protein ASG06_06850 [Rathayibacter sp. Leaf185]
MVDERGRDGDEPGGADRPQDPARPGAGSDWLLQQLSDGRLKSIFDAPRRRPAQPVAPAGEEPTAVDAAPETDAPVRSDVESGERDAATDDEPPAPSGSRPVASAVWPAEPLRVDSAQTGPDADTAAEEAPSSAAEGESVAQATESQEPASTSAEDATESQAGPAGAAAPAEQSAPESSAPEPVSAAPSAPEPTVQSPTPRAEETPAVAPDEPAPAAPPSAPDESRRTPQAPAATPPVDASPATTPAPLPTAEPPVDLPTAPPRLRAEAHRRDDRPEGATPPAPRDPAEVEAVASDTVYHWPDPRGGWDAPPVWEEVVAPREEPDDDGGDEELWRETAGVYAWNLEPTADETATDSGEPDRAEPVGDDAPTGAATPFRTAAAAAHVNATPTGAQEPRSRQPRTEKARTPREPLAPKEPKAPKEPRTPREPRAAKEPRAPREPRPARVATATSASRRLLERPESRRRLLIGLIALGVVIVLAALVALGIAIGSAGARTDGAAAPAPAATDPASASAAPSVAPTAEIPTVGPLPAGVWAWSTLLGGECLQPFDSVWAEEFTVVDCATAHTAEMVDTGRLTDATFPGQEALAVAVASICQAEGVVDVTGAEAYGDVQVSGAFPVTQEQWDAGERSYYCFVDRAGGGELIGTLDGTPSA